VRRALDGRYFTERIEPEEISGQGVWAELFINSGMVSYIEHSRAPVGKLRWIS
jgi:hypothetical protein